jgi:hypothetical protein
MAQLKANSISSYKEVFYADYQPNDGLFVDKYE